LAGGKEKSMASKKIVDEDLLVVFQPLGEQGLEKNLNKSIGASLW